MNSTDNGSCILTGFKVFTETNAADLLKTYLAGDK